METLKEKPVPNEKEQAMNTLGLMKETIQQIRLQAAGYQGNDLRMILGMLSDVAVTYASAMSENGEPAEANALLRESGLASLCDPE